MCCSPCCTNRCLALIIAIVMVSLGVVHIITLTGNNVEDTMDYVSPIILLICGFFLLLAVCLKKSFLYVPVIILFSLGVIAQISLIIYYATSRDFEELEDIANSDANITKKVESFWDKSGMLVQMTLTCLTMLAYVIGVAIFVNLCMEDA